MTTELRRSTGRGQDPWRYQPTPEEVDALIAAARRHPLGLSFLEEGALDSVSAIFGVHAFVVDQARVRLALRDSTKKPPAPARRAPAAGSPTTNLHRLTR